MNEEYCRWLAQVLDREALDSLVPAKILDSDSQQIAIGLVSPDTPGDQRTFWPDSPASLNSLVAHGTHLRYEDGREVEIFDVCRCPDPLPAPHVDFRIRS